MTNFHVNFPQQNNNNNHQISCLHNLKWWTILLCWYLVSFISCNKPAHVRALYRFFQDWEFFRFFLWKLKYVTRQVRLSMNISTFNCTKCCNYLQSKYYESSWYHKEIKKPYPSNSNIAVKWVNTVWDHAGWNTLNQNCILNETRHCKTALTLFLAFCLYFYHTKSLFYDNYKYHGFI